MDFFQKLLILEGFYKKKNPDSLLSYGLCYKNAEKNLFNFQLATDHQKSIDFQKIWHLEYCQSQES